MPPNLHSRILAILWSLLAILPTGTPEMKGLLPLAWFLACSVPAVQGGLLDLKSMIEKVTGKNALKNYGFYGCYCGWGGHGTPKDGTDWNQVMWPYLPAREAGKCSLIMRPGGKQGSMTCWLEMRSRKLLSHTTRSSLPHCFHQGAVGCMTTAMGGWRRRAATFGHSPTNTDSRGAWSPVSRGPSVVCSSVPVTGSSSTASRETYGATTRGTSTFPTSSASRHPQRAPSRPSICSVLLQRRVPILLGS
ncbi:phospholipase A2 group V isoform X2 [Callithrix jacchus]